MDTVEAGLATLGVAPGAGVHRAVRRSPPTRPPAADASEVPESLVIRLDRRKHTVRVPAPATPCSRPRGAAALRPPFSCEAGNCATCMAHLDKGSVTMRVNNALSADELDEGWVLTCQSIPTSAEIVVNYDA